MIHVEPLEARRHAAYDAFVDEHPRASVFHTRAWADNACASLGSEPPRTLVALEGDDVVGALPLAILGSLLRGRRLLSFPFCRFLEPLGERAGTVATLVDAARDLARRERCDYLELRSGALDSVPLDARSSVAFDNWYVDLSHGPDAAWSAFHARSTRRSIRVAQRSEVRVHRVSTGEGYRMLARLDALTRKRQGVPRHPPSFILGLGRQFEPRGLAYLLIAERQGVALAAELAIRHGSALHGILGVDAGPEARALRPNHALVWEAMRCAIAAGATGFDLGPAHRANRGLCTFKRYFGAVPTPVESIRIPIRGRVPSDEDPQAPAVRFARRTLRALPAPLASAVSPILAREVA